MLTWNRMSEEERAFYAPAIARFLLTRRANNRATQAGRKVSDAMTYRKRPFRRLVMLRKQRGLSLILPHTEIPEVGDWFGVDAYDFKPRLFPPANEPGAMTACQIAILKELVK
jgi:hypothetical protein